jgi:hypothetical protein
LQNETAAGGCKRSVLALRILVGRSSAVGRGFVRAGVGASSAARTEPRPNRSLARLRAGNQVAIRSRFVMEKTEACQGARSRNNP